MGKDDLVRRFLELSDGLLTDESFKTCLEENWDCISGFELTKFSSRKVRRIEEMTKIGKILTFKIERHGGTVNGSTRAELHHWEILFPNLSATLIKIGFRQLIVQSARYNPKDDVAAITEAIIDRNFTDERLKWSSDKEKCQVLSSTFIKADNNQTLASRKKRFKLMLKNVLTEHGYTISEQNWVSRIE